MKENLTSRVGRIISGSFNALVDAMESTVPETVMEEAIREIDGAIDEVRAELGRVMANKYLANTRLTGENGKHEDLSDKIELAVKENQDDLAETAIARQLDIEAQIPVLEATIAECSNKEKELEGYVRALQAKKREMQNELRQFRKSRQETSCVASLDASGESHTGAKVGVKIEKAGGAFERVLEKATGIAPGGGTPDPESAAQMAELENLAHKNRVRERLTAVKNRRQAGDES